MTGFNGPFKPYFEGRPLIEELEDGCFVRIYRPLRFHDSRGVLWEVPAGFECDGASIPRPLWPLIGGPLDGLHRDGALIHDWLYFKSRTKGFTAALRSEERLEADLVFYEAMEARGTPYLLRQAIYRGVRVGGWRPYAINGRGEGGSRFYGVIPEEEPQFI